MANLLLSFVVLHAAILGLASAVGTNYLLTGETLQTDDQLQFGGYTFVMQDDCNLVLYNGGWTSNTANNGNDCKLTLNEYGQLVIKNGAGSTVWTGGSKGASGKYAAVVHPEGRVEVYGPVVFTISPWRLARAASLGNVQLTNNILFAGQQLYGDAKLTARNHQLVMQGDCNLVLYGGNKGWQSNTHSDTQRYCFLRLSHRGELVIKDDNFATVWTSGKTSTTGDYVLIQQDNGFAVVYGPVVFSTKSSVSKNKIAMVTVQEDEAK